MKKKKKNLSERADLASGCGLPNPVLELMAGHWEDTRSHCTNKGRMLLELRVSVRTWFHDEKASPVSQAGTGPGTNWHCSPTLAWLLGPCRWQQESLAPLLKAEIWG